MEREVGLAGEDGAGESGSEEGSAGKSGSEEDGDDMVARGGKTASLNCANHCGSLPPPSILN